jgi:hypothetical protein
MRFLVEMVIPLVIANGVTFGIMALIHKSDRANTERYLSKEKFFMKITDYLLLLFALLFVFIYVPSFQLKMDRLEQLSANNTLELEFPDNYYYIIIGLIAVLFILFYALTINHYIKEMQYFRYKNWRGFGETIGDIGAEIGAYPLIVFLLFFNAYSLLKGASIIDLIRVEVKSVGSYFISIIVFIVLAFALYIVGLVLAFPITCVLSYKKQKYENS